MARKPPQKLAKMGRPLGADTFTDEIADEICARLSRGETLVSICADEWMPAVRTIYLWKDNHPDFSATYARAREIGFDAIAEKTRQTARGLGDSTDDVQRDRLIVETDLKLLSKWFPTRYGDKLDLNHSGAVGVTVKAEDLTDDELAARIAGK